MPIRDIFKKRIKPEKKEKPKITEEKTIEKEAPQKRKIRKVPDLAYKILRGPHITEKSTELTEKNQYVFKVYANANKVEIKRAIKQIYNVDVLDAKIINVPKRPRKFGKTPGFRKGYKKAIIKIKEGQKIDIFPK